MDILYQTIKKLSSQYQPQVVSFWRYLHQHPELSGNEYETAKYIGHFLESQNIPFKNNMGGNGIVAFVKGNNPDKNLVALRADMDALSITEKTGSSFSSQHYGIMHACGHDFHTANLMGTAIILNHLKGQFEGTVMLIFQPSEEKIPSGAQRMLQEGIFSEQQPKAIFALHVDPEIETGKTGICSGAFMAAADELYIKILGKGGHGAYSYKCIDPIVIAAQVILSLQTIISRNSNPLNPTVINIGYIFGDGETNIIPDKVNLKGTIRTFDNRWRKIVHKRIIDVITNTVKAYGGKLEIEIKTGYPPLINNVELTERCRQKLETALGKENVLESKKRMGAEDFSFFAQEFPATYLRLGVRNKKQKTILPLHTASFMADEDAFKTGMTMFCYLALTELQENKI